LLKNYFVISDEVQEALNNKKPVVALESTIIAHGMPYPQNVQTSLAVDKIIRKHGAIPATIGIINRKIVIGMNHHEIDHIGKNGINVRKVSRRDISACVAMGIDGGTTVSATMILAEMAGIPVFATGGIGGVHRGAEHTMDISNDLDEMGRTPVMVVCSGAKAILDLNKTLEFLETKGVVVVGYGTENLPAFFTRESGLSVDYRMDTAKQIADTFSIQRGLGIRSGILVCNPIPKKYEMPAEKINPAIDAAVHEAEEKGIVGKESTPFLLAKVKEITGGESLNSNIQLVYNNVALAADIACEMTY
jgi:pseudouridylate synthase